MMERRIDGLLLEGKYSETEWEVRTWTSNGVTERSVRRPITWVEVPHPDGGQWPPFDFLDPSDPKNAHIFEERRANALRKSARRAKTMCRHTIITEGFNEMLTFTYRENQSDRALCKVHFEKWVRRMKAALGTFRYCAAFEVQERGAMHIHCATHKLPQHGNYKGSKVKTWQLGTKIWRDIVGENNGLCFVGGKPSKWGSKARKHMSLCKMANYVSKYILKDFEAAPAESNRYSRSNGVVVGEVHVCRLTGPLADIVGLVFECKPGDILYNHNLGIFKDSYWLCTEPSIPIAPVNIA